MTRPVGNQVPDERQAKKREITDQVQYFVTNEFVQKPQPGFVQYAVLGKHHGVLKISAAAEAARPEGFHFL